MENGFLCRLFAAQLADVMPEALRRLMAECGNAEALWELGVSQVEAFDFLSAQERAELLAAKKRGLPYETAERMEKLNMRCVCIEEEAYPGKLRVLADPPYMIFYRGKLPEAGEKCVAVIGARSCGDYGRRAAERFGRELATAGVSVISGLARGIDGLAQSACINAGGMSYGI